jgi:peptidoglycan glycosyltransferase
MDRAIVRVAFVVTLMFALLLAFTSRWTIFEADDLRQNALNRRALLRQQQQPRGPILAANSRAIARSYATGSGADRIYRRRYTRPTIFAHPVGYSFVDLGNSGLESFYNDQLSGDREELLTVLDQFLGRRAEGRTMQTALDPDAQRIAGRQLGGQAGAVVVIEPRTGRVPVYVSVPGYDQNDARRPAEYARLRRAKDSPLFDRVGASGYPPGSTFKVVTATAALDSGKFTPQDEVNGNSPKTFSGRPLANAGDQSFGDISLTDALTNSVNTVWAQVGEQIGDGTLYEYMNRYGFNRKPPVDLPRGEVVASGVRDSDGDLIRSSGQVDVGRVAIGQERLAVTPLQMATVAATVANDGVRMEPRLAQEFRDRDGRVAKQVPPRRAQRVMSSTTAAELTAMMTRVVDEGTGTAAKLAGFPVAGKTGTAERGNGTNTAWFIGFAPVDDPQYAIAVAVEKTTGQGGTIAAPVARGVLESLLNK